MIKKSALALSLLIFGLTVLEGQSFSKPELRFLKRHSVNIHVDTLYSGGDWETLLKDIGNKTVVMLGEHNHGSNEVFLTRNDLIKALHVQLGFNTVLFESGIGEMAAINLNKRRLTPREMTEGFFGIWSNNAFRNLMNFIKTNDLSVGGFDVQRSGKGFDQLLKEQALNSSINSDYYHSVEAQFSRVTRLFSSNNKDNFDSTKSQITALIKRYGLLLEQFEKASYQSDELLIVKHTLINRVEFLRIRLVFAENGDWHQRFNDRDRAMAANIEWLLANTFKGEKVIVLGHNFHIAKSNVKEVVTGALLMEKYGTQIYTVGIYGGPGTYLSNSGKPQQTAPASAEKSDIKHVIAQQKGRVHFLSLSQRLRRGTQWLFSPIMVNDSFTGLNGDNKLILADHFNGIILIDKVSPPVR